MSIFNPFYSPISDDEVERRKGMNLDEWRRYLSETYRHGQVKYGCSYGAANTGYRRARLLEEILYGLISERKMTTKQVAAYFPEMTDRTIRNRLANLREQGRIKKIGMNWKVE